MGQKLKYEEIITGKLDALPLPDMADAIWSRIEQQLDLELPTGDMPPDPPSSPTGGWNLMGGLSLLFIAGFITIFLLTRKNESLPVNRNDVPVKEQNSATGNPKLPDKTTMVPVEPLKKAPRAVTPVVTLPMADSSVVTSNNRPSDSVVVTALPSMRDNTVPAVKQPGVPQKKQKGVTGISDSDYRIVPKKDSSD